MIYVSQSEPRGFHWDGSVAGWRFTCSIYQLEVYLFNIPVGGLLVQYTSWRFTCSIYQLEIYLFNIPVGGLLVQYTDTYSATTLCTARSEM